MISQRLANFQYRFLTPTVTSLRFVTRSQSVRISSISICNDIVPRERKRRRLPILTGRGHVARRHSRLPAKRGRDEYTYIDVSQISDAVNGCIWLVVKAAPLIPRVSHNAPIRKASVVNTTSLSLTLSSLPHALPSHCPFLSFFYKSDKFLMSYEGRVGRPKSRASRLTV